MDTLRGAAPASAPHLLLVAAGPQELGDLAAMLLPDGYRLETAQGGPAGLDAAREELPDLILLHAGRPELDACAFLRRLQDEPWTRETPVLVVAPADRAGEGRRALEAGAEDMLRAPVEPAELRARVRSLLGAAAALALRAQTEETLVLIARAVDGRDPTNAEHSARVARLAEALGKACGLSGAPLHALRIAGHVHDIGMVVVPERVLLKPGSLDAREAALLHSHPVVGEALLRPLAVLDEVRALVRHHHERLDGSGYPDRLRGADVGLPVRILALADVFDVLTSRRPFHPPLSRTDALAVLRAEAAAGRWDPEVLGHLAACIPPAPAAGGGDWLRSLSLPLPEGR